MRRTRVFFSLFGGYLTGGALSYHFVIQPKWREEERQRIEQVRQTTPVSYPGRLAAILHCKNGVLKQTALLCIWPVETIRCFALKQENKKKQMDWALIHRVLGKQVTISLKIDPSSTAQFIVDTMKQRDAKRVVVFACSVPAICNELLACDGCIAIATGIYPMFEFRDAPIRTYLWLSICAFVSDSLWFKLPNEVVIMIARMIHSHECAARKIAISPTRIASRLSRATNADLIVLIECGDERKEFTSDLFYKSIVPSLNFRGDTHLLVIQKQINGV